MCSEQGFDAKAFVRGLTGKPGVYTMLDEAKTVIYVGKAKNLKKRVASYFTRTEPDPKTRVMVARVRAINVIVTHTEKEALVLENNLIKQLKPRYNIWFRDDKSYPCIYLSADHDFPRLSYHRGAKRGKGRYFGPYPNAGAVRNTLNLMKKLFRIRQCSDSFYANRTRPCLEYQIKRCSAPCVGLISKNEYQKAVTLGVLFLQGKNEKIMQSLLAPMQQAVDRLDYERAAQYRDQISNLRKIQARQYVVSATANIDAIACSYQEGTACIQIVFIRNGINQGSQSYFPAHSDNSNQESVISAFLPQFYLNKKNPPDFPKEIILQYKPENIELLEEVISAKVGRRITVKYRLRGARAKCLSLAQENAAVALAQHLAGKKQGRQRLRKLQEILHIDHDLKRMECFDISHTGGELTVASCVAFGREGPLKADYRKFNIADVTPADDCAAIAQAVLRRLSQAKADKIPDIIFIDGGKGQLNAAKKVLRALGLSKVLLIAVAKGPMRKAGLETLIIEKTDGKLHLATDSPALHLVQQIRDEAHRFALTGHRQRRQKNRNRSPLQDVVGIGNKRRRELLRYFGGLQGIANAGLSELVKVAGINQHLGQKIYDRFHAEK